MKTHSWGRVCVCMNIPHAARKSVLMQNLTSDHAFKEEHRLDGAESNKLQQCMYISNSVVDEDLC